MLKQVGEPVVSVGLMAGTELVVFELNGEHFEDHGHGWPSGTYLARPSSSGITIEAADGRVIAETTCLKLRPRHHSASFVIREVPIGIEFHWEQKTDQRFTGRLRLQPTTDHRLMVINEVSLEAYLVSVISSEMSATADPELLKAHAIISRSWLLAQLENRSSIRQIPVTEANPSRPSPDQELIRWYDRENHANFDVCADDHCQRYQGITTATTPAVAQAVYETRGMVLCNDGDLCDTRFSKSCGGMTEQFSTAWSNQDYPYLDIIPDTPPSTAYNIPLPLSIEKNAETWIRNRPAAFCNTSDVQVLKKILPDFDRETTDFYRWQVTIPQSQLQLLLNQKLGLGLGRIRRLEPLERGGSGRIVRLRIIGENGAVIIGKELEIRRALSTSHLYSSAFIVEHGQEVEGFPDQFLLIGAGWGHGVGLCQIGAAIMAETGYRFDQILFHYYPHSTLECLYQSPTIKDSISSPKGLAMDSFFYRYTETERRRLMADAGFVRGQDRIWTHPDGSSIGEGVAMAIADESFFRFLKLDPPEIEVLDSTGSFSPRRHDQLKV